MRPAVVLQYMLPHHLLSRIVFWATRWTWRPWKRLLISTVIKNYHVDMSQALQPDPEAYASFNAFFTRALRADARPHASNMDALCSPADGIISQIGMIRDGRIFQAKGFDFSVDELLADSVGAADFAGGSFVTIYLSPRDYHRVHMPVAGTLESTIHIPGRLFSVAPFTVNAVPRLFARNERLICQFRAEDRAHRPFPFVVAMVGAMLVSSVETVWGGLEIPPYASRVTRKSLADRGVRLPRDSEMGHFNMGSTVIVLLPAGVSVWEAALHEGGAVTVGQPIGRLLQ